MTSQLKAAGKTHVGQVRADNEDALLVDLASGVFAVADGMGGHAAGEVASRLAVEALKETLSGDSEDSPSDRMYGSYNLANARIREEVVNDSSRQGMGTTLVAAKFDSGTVLIANVGDSRAYLVRDGRMRQVTTDHSWVMEQVDSGRMDEETAANHPYRNVITRALGSREDVDVDLFKQTLEPGDRLLLCSDGLTGMLGDSTILEILEEETNLETAVARLIEEANESGGEDNITAVIVEYS